MHSIDDKLNSINRSFFDAEHGWITLVLSRFKDLYSEFPNDPQIEYAEALIRKDFLGQGLKAEELFIKANGHAKDRRKSNENYLFSTFNAVKYARNEKEFLERFEIARSLAQDDPDMTLFNQIVNDLKDGYSYGQILSNAVFVFQQENKYGDCACFAELAINAEDLSMDEELALRKARMSSLRELDKNAEASRTVRGEGFPPQERLALQEAINEMGLALLLDPDDHMLWNFKSAWLYLLERLEEALIAADKSLSLCPTGYVKPLTNKALILQKFGRKEESKTIAQKALNESIILGDEGLGDKELSQNILESLEIKPPSDDHLLGVIAERIINSVGLTAQQEMNQWKGSNDGKELLRGLKHRVSFVNNSWNKSYFKIMEELLYDFCPETAYITIMRLGESKQEAYQHCLHAILYIAAHRNGVLQRDACRLLIFMILGAGKPGLIRSVYREAILGPTIIGYEKFSNLDRNMRNEMTKFNPVLIKLIAEQPPLNQVEINKARLLTMARFIDGISRDPVINKKLSFWDLLFRFFSK